MTDTTPRNQAALEFLLARRSRPYKILAAPMPDRDEIETLLTAASRVPDHGKLEPFRFVVHDAAAMKRLAQAAAEHGQKIGKAPEDIEKMRFQLDAAPLAISVIFSPKASEKIPLSEQGYAAGSACLSLLNACLAAGWGANWLTGWAAHDGDFCRANLGLGDGESLVGWVHIGTAKNVPPERPRPDVAGLTIWDVS